MTSSCLFAIQLYESALSENQKLKSKLQDAQVELTDIKTKLDKIAQVRKCENKEQYAGLIRVLQGL